MKIVKQNKKELEIFGNLKNGVFFEARGKVYLKINSSLFRQNAYDCEDDRCVTFGASDEITILNAKVVIE